MGLHGKLAAAIEFKAAGVDPKDAKKRLLCLPNIISIHAQKTLFSVFRIDAPFKAGGDVFHDFFSYTPQHVSTATEYVHGCELVEGQFGKVGSIIRWTYTHDGKQRKAKELVEKIDEEKKVIVLKVLEGDLLELYKDFVITAHVEKKGEDIDLVTWTLEYEMLNEDVDHPMSLLSYFIDITKDMEAHLVQKS